MVAELNPHDETGGTSLTISLPASSKLLEGALLGDSISVNGVCLTATDIHFDNSDTTTAPPSFKVGIAPETLRLTNLGSLATGSGVNLERAVRADTRMGGHFVQGHVDTTASIAQISADGNALTFRLAPRALDVLRYVVHKGYVALDGTSLTVTAVNDAEGWFEVMLIVYTQQKVVLARKKVGESVNLEVDVLAKYAEKSMAGYLGAQGEMLVKPILEGMVENLVAQAMGGHAS